MARGRSLAAFPHRRPQYISKFESALVIHNNMLSGQRLVGTALGATGAATGAAIVYKSISSDDSILSYRPIQRGAAWLFAAHTSSKYTFASRYVRCRKYMSLQTRLAVLEHVNDPSWRKVLKYYIDRTHMCTFGAELKVLYPGEYAKRVPRDRINKMYKFTYKDGLNLALSSHGIHFVELENIGEISRGYGELVARVDIPDDARVDTWYGEFAADKVVLTIPRD